MARAIGCNTLYPAGRLVSERDQFTLEAHKESLEIINDAGLDACEFSHYAVLSDAECEALHSACNSLGVLPWSAHLWISLPARVAAVAERESVLREGVRKAGLLGVRVIVVHAESAGLDMTVPESRTERWEALTMTAANILDDLEDRNITIAIENCSRRPDLEFLVGFVDSLDHPLIGLNIDTGHARLHGMTPGEAIRLMGARLRSTHLQDNFGSRDDHLPPGCGSIDWDDTFRALRDVEYKGVLMVEISDCPPGREPDARAETATAAVNVRRLRDRWLSE